MFPLTYKHTTDNAKHRYALAYGTPMQEQVVDHMNAYTSFKGRN